MIDFERTIGFDWDSGNKRKSVDKHGVNQEEAEQVFFNLPLLLVEDIQHSQAEQRIHALGKTKSGRLLHVTFTLRHHSTRIRVISARDMNRKERHVYGQKTQANPRLSE
ncbi:MAG: BrnT family toxin [Magnetococcales bacterium]|nr:BrnT family toxin [Magnetococcales bacterium]